MSERKVDFSRYPRKRIAIMFMYHGWEYHGLVRQADSTNTVEEHIFSALLKTRLIEKAELCDWTRCGRTDKGVSAFRQVAALTIRFYFLKSCLLAKFLNVFGSTDVSGSHHFWPEGSAAPELRITGTTKELPYVKMLNGVLPKTIRVLAHSIVTDERFSARHDCIQRVYTYIFPRALVRDVSAMNEACALLVGEHDFRNFCRLDRNESRIGMTYMRTIKKAVVEEMSNNKTLTSEPNQFDLLRLTIGASGFLWHQIRCIVSLLYEIGCGNERPELITQLLDVDEFPSRPQYNLANELPLCLFDCNYPDGTLNWEFDQDSIRDIIHTLQKQWAEHQTKAANIKQMLDELSAFGNTNTFAGLDEFLRAGPAPKNYKQMSKRPRCKGLSALREQMAIKKAKTEESHL